MADKTIYECQCAVCVLPETHPMQAIHHQMNVLLSRLDEQQRRWYVALEAKKLGHGGIEDLMEITGMDASTIRRGGRELANNLEDRPVDRIRLSGGGRLRAEKNNRD